MNKLVIKILSVLSIVLLGIGLSACGKKEVTNKEEGDGFAYYASFSPIDIDLKNGYISTSKVMDGVLYAVGNEYDENYENSSTSIYTYSFADGTLSKINMEVPKDAYITNMLVDSEKNIKALFQKYDDMTGEVSYELISYDNAGAKKEEIDLSEVLSEASSDQYLQNIMEGSDKNLYFLYDSAVIVADAKGNVICNIPVENYPNNIFEDEDGSVHVCTRNETNWNLCTKKVNLSSKTLENGYDDLGNNGNVFPGQKGKLLIANDDSVYEYDVTTKEKTLLWNWIDVDISNYYSDAINVNPDGTYSYLNRDWSGEKEKIELVKLERKERAKGEKEIITYGCMYLDYEIKNNIFDFNKKNEKYRITVKTYGNDDGDYQAGIDKFNMDIVDGKVDIIQLGTIDPVALAKKKALAPLDSYYESTMKAEDYFGAVIDAGKIDGKLYSVAPNFTIQTLAMPKSVADTIPNWDMKALLDLRKKYSDKPFMEYGSKESAFAEIFYSSLDRFVDRETGKCDFMNEDFYNVLEYANSFPQDVDYENFDSWAEIRNKNVILVNMYLYSTESVDLYTQLFGEEIGYVGYPGVAGNGSILGLSNPLGISEKSKNKDGAWEFIEGMFKYNGPEDYYNYFPTNKARFYDMMKKAMEIETYVDENGVTQQVSHSSWGNGDTNIDLYGINQAQADGIEKLIDGAVSITNTMGYTDEIYNIMQEEVQAYFAGQKTPEDVANIIQSRVSIYLAENK